MKDALRVYLLDDFLEYLDKSSFRFSIISCSEEKIAIATSKNLIITEGFPFEVVNFSEPTVQTVLEFNEENGRPTSLKWMSAEVVGVGFENGFFACFLVDGSPVIEFRAHDSSLQALRISSREFSSGSGAGLWMLFEGGVLVTVSSMI